MKDFKPASPKLNYTEEDRNDEDDGDEPSILGKVMNFLPSYIGGAANES